MNLAEILNVSEIDDIVYVVKTIKINWTHMIFNSTKVVVAEYKVEPFNDPSLWGAHRSNHLVYSKLPEGTKNYPSYFNIDHNEYQFFKTQKEAEIWKILELQDLENKVNEYITKLQEKTNKKIKSLKKSEQLDEYIEKYPEIILKVI